MDAKELFTTVLSSSYTHEDVQRRMTYVRQFLETSAFTPDSSISLDTWLNSKPIQPYDREILVSYGDEFYTSFTKDTMYTLFDTMRKELKSLPRVDVYVPFEPGPEQIAGIGTWLRTNAHPSALVSLHYDVNLISGCSLVWQGMYRDFSFRNLVRRHQQDIINIINSYAN